MRIQPCAAAPDSSLHQGCRPGRLLALQNSWTLDRTLRFRSSFPQAPVAPFFRSIPLPCRRFSTSPMDFGSSPCKVPRSVLGQRAEQSMLRKESQSQWWPVLQVGCLQLPRFSSSECRTCNIIARLLCPQCWSCGLVLNTKLLCLCTMRLITACDKRSLSLVRMI